MRTKSWIIGTMLAVLLWLCFAAVLMWASEKHAKAAVYLPHIHASLLRPETDDWFSSYTATERIIQGQEPVEPSGNPGHDPDRPECDGSPKQHQGKMLKCECAKWHSCAESPDTERKSCSNFCWRAKCKCKIDCE